jgi:hypothetical protein
VPPPDRRRLLDAVHDALVSVGVPPADRFQRVIALADADFCRRGYPRAPGPARRALSPSSRCCGRSAAASRSSAGSCRRWSEGLQAIGHDPENVLLVFKETQWENWSFAGGRLLHA